MFFQDSSKTWQVAVYSNNEVSQGMSRGPEHVYSYVTHSYHRRFRDRVSFRSLRVRYVAQTERLTYSTPYFRIWRNESAPEYGASCVQYAYPSSTESEDYLFLNIWTPYLLAESKSSSDLKDAIFHIHGGGFQAGSGSDLSFGDGTLVSRGNVV